MHSLGYMETFNAIRKLRRGPTRKHEMYPGGKVSFGEGFHYPEFVFMSLAITYAQKVGELQTVAILSGLIGRVNPAPNVEDLLCRHARPFDNLRTRKFRDRKDPEGTCTSSFHYGGVVQPNEQTAVLRTVNVTEVVDGEDEPCSYRKAGEL